MTLSRRSFVKSSALALTLSGSMSSVLTAQAGLHHHGHPGRGPKKPKPFEGYGELVPDPNGIVDLPKGFSYRVLSKEGDELSRKIQVPGSHDGQAAFGGGPFGTYVVRNHEIHPEDVAEDGVIPVALVPGVTYDPEGTGGTTTLVVGHNGRLLDHRISLAGTVTNCAGGPSPWGTWLTCEEDVSVFDKKKPHGYVFEVDPVFGGNPLPIKPLGRFEHEAVAFDERGRVYLTEDADSPFGLVYRFLPFRPFGGKGSLFAGGTLAALKVLGVSGDLSSVQVPGTVLPVRWLPIRNPNPGENDAPTREQGVHAGATPIQKAEGIWTDRDGSIWFVASYGGGPDAEDEEDRSAAAHGGQIWRYDPSRETLTLVVIFAADSTYDGPDNITVSPYEYAVAATDGEDEQWLVGINEEGGTFPLAFNAFSDDEFAGPTFSPDGKTLFANIQGQPAFTIAIQGPFAKRG